MDCLPIRSQVWSFLLTNMDFNWTSLSEKDALEMSHTPMIPYASWLYQTYKDGEIVRQDAHLHPDT